MLLVSVCGKEVTDLQGLKLKREEQFAPPVERA